eukprot:1150117-Pelagomonas_calceolata.AAC.2
MQCSKNKEEIKARSSKQPVPREMRSYQTNKALRDNVVRETNEHSGLASKRTNKAKNKAEGIVQAA